MTHGDIITLHEVGHFIALYTAGLYEEFTFITNEPQTYEGKLVEGLTKRNGDSLTAIKDRLAGLSTSGWSAEKIYSELDIIFAEAKQVCLPHLVFYFGGGAMDDKIGKADEVRNRIDVESINKVINMMGVKNIAKDKLSSLQNIIYDYLFKVFDIYSNLVGTIYKALLEKGTINKAEMDPIIEAWEKENKVDIQALQTHKDKLIKQYNDWLLTVKQ